MNYRLLETRELPDLQGTGHIYEHDKTKARVCFIKTDDDNKTFSISFRTPPWDDTGLPHILEHTVLCGSRKYPIKDPFIELAKGSLNTFLNAITYSDKTMYPIASVNDKDFHNLMDVYLDAVFYPNIYDTSLTFEQEGWHHELFDVGDETIYKGVVYNEMKGVFSSPEQILYRKIQQEMFENHPYSYESGGDPLAIPTLTYEDFIRFHETYYHPSNSFIFFFGDLEIEKELEYLDEEYLSKFEFKQVDSQIPLVERYDAVRDLEVGYPVAKGDTTENKTYLSYNVLLGESKDILDGVGLDILEYLLVDAPGAPIKEALIDAGIGQDILCHFDAGIREGVFSFIAKNASSEDKQRFVVIIDEVLSKISETGFDDKKVQAAINKFEFRAKEADFGQYPKGIIYAIKVLETWLYDEDPFVNFEYDKIFTEVKEATKEGLLQDLIKKYFAGNKHKVLLSLVPDETYNEKKEAQVKEELEAFDKSLSPSDREALVERNKELRNFQEAPETKENMEKLPLLKLSDIPADKKEFLFKEEMIRDSKMLLHEANASDIAYVKASFDVSHVPEGQLAMLSLMARMMIKLSTSRHHYGELSDEINLLTGGVSVLQSVYEHKSSSKYFVPRLEISGKCFVPKLHKMFGLFKEIMMETEFDDVKRMRELMNETKSRMQMAFFSSAHSTAMLRAQSYFSASSAYKEKLRGVEFYEELKLWLEKTDEDLRDLGMMMKRMLSDIVISNGLTIGVTGSQEYMNDIETSVRNFVHGLPYQDVDRNRAEVSLIEPHKEGFKTTSDVQYVAMAADFSKHGFDYHGSMKVLNTIINLDYLWNNIRVKGGAYGAFAGVGRNGSMYFASYRDPNLTETIDNYKKIEGFIQDLDLDERELTKYIIGTISPLDQPLTASLENDKMMSLYYTEVNHDDILKNRKEILSTSIEDLKGHLEMYQKIFLEEFLCVVGGGDKIEGSADVFDKTYELK